MIERRERLLGEHLFGRAVCQERAVFQREDARCVAERLIGVVAGKNDGIAIRAKLRHALHHAEAVAVVQIRRRLVHDEHPRVLHERARNEHELPLAAADALAAALG